MPRRDLIKINGEGNYGLNVFDTVGISGANNPGDVMVVQAMFRYLAELWRKHSYDWKMPLRDDLFLEPNGQVGKKTYKAILAYQRFNRYELLSADGVIHPAKYDNRNIKFGGTRVMTITLMHWDVYMADETLDYTGEIARRFPNVAFWIR
jgi:hypothetical protein